MPATHRKTTASWLRKTGHKYFFLWITWKVPIEPNISVSPSSGVCPYSILSSMKCHKTKCLSLCIAFWIKAICPRTEPLPYKWKSYKTGSKQSFPCCYFLHSVSCETELVSIHKIFGRLPPCGFCINKYLLCADNGKYINAEYVGICISQRENVVQVDVSILCSYRLLQ